MRLISLDGLRWLGQSGDLTTILYRLIFTITQVFKDSRFVFHATGKFRRLWLAHFRKEFVQGQLLVRQGNCRQCGTCCSLLFTCPMLSKQRRCFVYGSCRPQACKIFPIDQRDIDEVNICSGYCGYHFGREDSIKLREENDTIQASMICGPYE